MESNLEYNIRNIEKYFLKFSRKKKESNILIRSNQILCVTSSSKNPCKKKFFEKEKSRMLYFLIESDLEYNHRQKTFSKRKFP